MVQMVFTIENILKDGLHLTQQKSQFLKMQSLKNSSKIFHGKQK